MGINIGLFSQPHEQVYVREAGVVGGGLVGGKRELSAIQISNFPRNLDCTAANSKPRFGSAN
jgi:hypothetical protein